MSCQVTKLNHAKSHQDSADKDMPAPIITIPGIADAVQGNSDIDQLLVHMLSMVMNGVSQLIVRVETIALIVTQERNSNFILRYISQQSVMICSRLGTAPEDLSVLLLM